MDLPGKNQASKQIRVALVTPAGAVRAGLKTMLAEDAYVRVVSEAAAFVELETELTDVDLVVMTIGAVRAGNWEKELPGLGFLLLADEPEELLAILPDLFPRAWGLLPLDSSAEVLIAAVRAVAEGLVVSIPGLFRQQTGFVQRDGGLAGDIAREPLTPREVEVLQTLASGLTNKQIAVALGIRENTVKFHISSVYAKLGVLNRAEAVRVGVRQGLIAV